MKFSNQRQHSKKVNKAERNAIRAQAKADRKAAIKDSCRWSKKEKN